MPPNDFPSLSPKEFVALNLLVGAPRRKYGLQLVEESSGALKRGTVYITLNRLEEKGYVESKLEDEPPAGLTPRRLYKATGVGVQVFRAVQAMPGAKAFLRGAMA